MSGQAPLARSVGGIAGQVREYVNDLRDGAPDKVAPAAASLRALAGDGSAGKVPPSLGVVRVCVGVGCVAWRAWGAERRM
jgi:hypothetical protein